MARGKWITPDEPGDSNVARCLSVPSELQPAVNWALQQLTFAANWEQVGTLTPQECADAMVDVLAAYYESEDCTMAGNPNSDFILWREGQVTNGAAIAAAILATQELNGYWWQSTFAINDEVEFFVMLEQGEYDLTVHGRRNSNHGIQHWLIDGVEDANTIDMYSASTQINYEATISVSVATSGLHSIKCKMSTKNASSNGYGNQMTWLKLFRTGP